MPYEPRNPHHLRYIESPAIDDPKLLKEIHKLGGDVSQFVSPRVLEALKRA